MEALQRVDFELSEVLSSSELLLEYKRLTVRWNRELALEIVKLLKLIRRLEKEVDDLADRVEYLESRGNRVPREEGRTPWAGSASSRSSPSTHGA